ncbi:DUF3718 domain-containing protein [Colwellia sp. MEBiC06753]
MKIITAACLTLGVALSSPLFAANYIFVATDNSKETQLCVNAGNNNVQALKHTIRQMGPHQRKASVNFIRCNDLSPAKFAHKYQAHNTTAYLNRYSFKQNKVTPTVTIKDVAKVETAPKVIYVSAAR